MILSEIGLFEIVYAGVFRIRAVEAEVGAVKRTVLELVDLQDCARAPFKTGVALDYLVRPHADLFFVRL